MAALKTLPAHAGCKIRVEGRCKGAGMTCHLKIQDSARSAPSGLIKLEPSNGGHRGRLGQA
jgi:hypothetical protein